MPTFCSNEEHKFYIYNVDSRYDGLIGSDLLKELEASVDMKDQILHTRFTSIPIIYNPAPYNVKIHARSEQRVKLPTDQYSGHAILNFKEFCPGVRMPTAIVECNNGYATTIIQNLTDKDITIGITRPFLTSDFIEDTLCDVNYTTQQNIEIDKILEQNLYNKLRLDHMTDEERIRIQNLCIQYKDIFYCEDLPLTFTSQVKHQIRTKNEDPIYVKPYRLAPAQTEEINRQVQKLLKDDVIRESHSPWCAPVHLVPKRSDASGEIKYRMVIDYRRLNDLTTDDKYPLPNITDLFDKLGKSTYFSTIDLASGYHQIELEESDKQKTAFSTQHGHFEFQRMPFGLKTAPATFQRAMDSVLRGLQGIHCLVYLDDIIVYSSSLEEHIRKLRAVFDRLRQTNLKVQLDKTEFLRKEVLYLGHKITKDGLKPNEDKIKAVMDFPIPKTTTEIKSFLGLVGYYRKFIKDFAKITQPLTNCLKKRNKISIDTDYINAFNKCKELLCNAPLLQYPDPSKPYILTTDASNVALGGVLSQGPIGSDKPIAYASRTLSDTESRYSTIERELLAIIWAIKHFRPYLYGQKFFIYTDHRPLAWLNSMKDPSSKLTRWRLSLQDYNFEIIYKNGKQNTNADALSRIKVNATDSDDDISMKVNVDQKEQKLQKHIDSLTKEITKLTRKKSSSTLSISDSERTHTISPISEVISISSGDKEPTQFVPSVSSSADTIHSAVDMETTGIPILHEAIDTKPNQLLIFTWFRDTCQVKDLSRNKQKVLEVHLPLDNEQLIKDFLKKYVKLKTKYFIYFENQEHRRLFTNIIIQLFRQDMVQFYECTERVIYVEDEDEQKQIIIKHHEGKTVHRAGDHFLCTEEDAVMYPETTCIEQLMKFEENPSQCQQHKVHIENSRVQQLSHNEWILYTNKKTRLIEECSNSNRDDRYLQGTYKLTLLGNCTVILDNLRIHQHRVYQESATSEPTPAISLPEFRSSNLSGAPALNMKEVDFDDLKYMSYTLKQSAFSESVVRPDYSLGTVILYGIPRHAICTSPSNVSLEVFVDASQAAYAACVYLRSTNDAGDVNVRLLCSKSRVAPLKTATIPRLELCGALLGARLADRVTTALRGTVTKKTFWTDSTIVLGWIKTQPKVLKTFVCNRIQEIHELTSEDTWRWVPTSMNPSDLASRGIDPIELQSSTLWWHGPDYLKKDETEWPKDPRTKLDLPEIKTNPSTYVFYTPVLNCSSAPLENNTGH
ncbi:unnamed protein product [Plutella xylostella]|uniref:(diamondback moth) hypothetical protein n=1 Tax=Plutella xylostella TaxID=51655 RepID=A0A8S4G3I1_PLUXY|nr:unnamed protein product [Plutella xylostella]